MDQADKRPPPSWTPSQPSSDPFNPPAKRQRLSPPAPQLNGARPNYAQNTPYARSPNVQNFSLPSAYTQRTPQTNGYQGNTFGRQSMGPPQRPAEKPAPEQREEQQTKPFDMNDYNDVVTAAGIDVRREEELMSQSTYGNRSFNTTQSSSGPSSFDLLSSSSFGGIGSRGTLNQPPLRTPEQVVDEQHKRAAYEKAKRGTAHLDDPFLSGYRLRLRMEKICQDHGVKMPMEGLYDKKPPDRPQATVMAGSGQDAAGILAAKAPSILHRGVPLESIFTLLSLAANERIRGLLEDAYGIARGRRATSNGVVPPEWSDIAVSANGTDAQPTQILPSTSITGTSWDRPPEASDDQPPQPQPTISFPPKSAPLAKSLSLLAKKDRDAEEARLKKRAERKARKAAAASATNGDAATGLTPGMLGEKAPEIKMTKKEREKLAKQDVSEEVATRNANATAALALGGGSSKYSWMTKGAASKPSSLGGSRICTPGIGGGANKASASLGKDGLPPATADRKFGVWKEDGPGGKDVQLRDWIDVLDVDGRDRKALCLAMSKLGREQSQD